MDIRTSRDESMLAEFQELPAEDQASRKWNIGLIILCGVLLLEILILVDYDRKLEAVHRYTEEVLIATNTSAVVPRISCINDYHLTTAQERVYLNTLTTESNSRKTAAVGQAMDELRRQEKKILNPFPIKRRTGAISDAYQYDQGVLHAPSVGVEVHLYYSGEQAVCDRVNSAFVYPLAGVPIGVPGGTSVLGDHNNQTGGRICSMDIGSNIYITTPYGEFLYQVIGKEHGYQSADKTTIYNDAGEIVLSTNGTVKPIDGLLFYTCYPFHKSRTNERYMIYARLVSGTKLT